MKGQAAGLSPLSLSMNDWTKSFKMKFVMPLRKSSEVPTTRLLYLLSSLLLGAAVASCTGGGRIKTDPNQDPEIAPDTIPERLCPILFEISGGERALTGVRVFSVDRSGITGMAGSAGPDRTIVNEIVLTDLDRKAIVELPGGIKMDGYFFEYQGRDVVVVSCGLLCYEERDASFSGQRITYIAAPISSNQDPGPKFSLFYREIGQNWFQLDGFNPESEDYGAYGVVGLATETLPGGTANYRGIWAGSHCATNPSRKRSKSGVKDQ